MQWYEFDEWISAIDKCPSVAECQCHNAYH